MKLLFYKSFILLLSLSYLSATGQIYISNHPENKIVLFGNSKIKITLDYNFKCVIKSMEVNKQAVISNKDGVFTGIRVGDSTYSTCSLVNSPKIETLKNAVVLSQIIYGPGQTPLQEIWKFLITDSDIKLNIERTIRTSFVAEEVSFPKLRFNSINTWTGAFLDYGGLAWFYLFNEKLCTYGVHSAYSSFWNHKTGNGLTISGSSPGKKLVSTFTRSLDDELVYSLSLADTAFAFRYEAEKRSRFIRKKINVWDTVIVNPGKYSEMITFSWFNYLQDFNRGHLVGINEEQVTSVLNTIARIGVIDAKLFGANSWHTPYGPICLHEQYIAQLGIAINDRRYLDGYKQCLDYYRDKALEPDGRVLARWAYLNEDAMPGKVSPEGFYEAQWGYLLDSNPDYVTNVSELYNQNGDLFWVKQHKSSCERALDYMLQRDANANYLVEMKTDNHTEKKGSDWIDIIWASYENAFVNAKLYYALTLWSHIEKQLGDSKKAMHYASYASQLKKSFNKSTKAGGFWDEKNNWYVYWLNKDQSVHGNNLTVPVNFMAIAYGICDDPARRMRILDAIEQQMQKENLFAWPLCMFSFTQGEGNDWQFPFPNYENGDIFLSWGAVGVEAYAPYKPELALKYIKNILSRYEKDGLAYQRYGRLKQDGLGDDILAGNSLAIVGLYKSIYGINPMYNRMYLNPHLPASLSGTILNYNFRGKKLTVQLDKNRYSISDGMFKLSSKNEFGFQSSAEGLEYFHRAGETPSLKLTGGNISHLSIAIHNWDDPDYAWRQTCPAGSGKITYYVSGLKAQKRYNIDETGKRSSIVKTDDTGGLKLEVLSRQTETEFRIRPL